MPAVGNPLMASGLSPWPLPCAQVCQVGAAWTRVKSLESSQPRILDSFIRESSFLWQMFSTRLRLVEACERQPITGLRPSPLRVAVWTACVAPQGQCHPLSHLAPPGSLLHHGVGPHPSCSPWGTVGVQFVLGPQTVPAGPGQLDSNACLLQLHHAAVGPTDKSRAPSCHHAFSSSSDQV